jgi:exodeoxyribonuclease V alpha subunit
MTLHSLLKLPFASASQTPLTGLDVAFANYLQQQQPSDDAHHLWLAALTSHQWGRGHACLDLHALSTQAAELLGWSAPDVSHLPNALAQAAASMPWTQGDNSPLVYNPHTQQLYLRRAWHAETLIRHNLQQRLAQGQTVPNDLQTRLDHLFPNAQAHDKQRQACEVAARHAITLITGGPGTGKTTTVVRLLALLVGTHEAPSRMPPLRIHLAAPTGKAAARLTESITQAMGQLPADVQARIPTQAQTLHRLLQTQSNTSRIAPLATDVVVVDEASMVDLEMMARLLQAVPLTARLILLGDKDQLASVEAGAVMSQLCTGPLLREQTVTLTHSHRFDAQSGIGQWAQAVNQDNNRDALQTLWHNTPDWLAHTTLSDAPHVTRMDLKSAQASQWEKNLRHAWRDYLHQLQSIRTAQRCDDVQASELLQAFSQFSVLCAVREGPWGVTQLNRHIASALQLKPANSTHDWYIGRPVMVTRNDYALDLMNGDIGICLPHTDDTLRVAFARHHTHGAGVRWVATSRLDHVDTVFAMTVHKSQGSEFAHVLLVLPAIASPVLTRELVYTGITRARQRLTLWAPQLEVLLTACGQRVWRSGGLGQA